MLEDNGYIKGTKRSDAPTKVYDKPWRIKKVAICDDDESSGDDLI